MLKPRINQVSASAGFFEASSKLVFVAFVGPAVLRGGSRGQEGLLMPRGRLGLVEDEVSLGAPGVGLAVVLERLGVGLLGFHHEFEVLVHLALSSAGFANSSLGDSFGGLASSSLGFAGGSLGGLGFGSLARGLSGGFAGGSAGGNFDGHVGLVTRRSGD